MLKCFRVIGSSLACLAATSYLMHSASLEKTKLAGRLVPPVYHVLDRGTSLAETISPDGRKIASLVSLSPFWDENFPPQMLTLQLWDADKLTLLASRDVPGSPKPGTAGTFSLGTQVVGPDRGKEIRYSEPYVHFIRYSNNGNLLVYSDLEAQLHIVEARDLREIHSIDVDRHTNFPRYGPVSLEISPSGDRVAYGMSGLDDWNGPADLPGEVRIYSLDTHRLQAKASFDEERIGGIAWSPDGLKLALTLQSFGRKKNGDPYLAKDKENLVILDSASGRVLSRFKTGDLAGAVRFGPHGELFSAASYPSLLGAPFHVFSHESVKVLDVATGVLARSISYPGRDVHD